MGDYQLVLWIVVIILLIILWELIVNYSVNLLSFLSWLKGSRTSYYISANGLRLEKSSDNRRESIQPVIEINRGLFRRKSAIYGSHAKNWKIMRSWNWKDGDGRDCISLGDTKGLRAEVALKLIEKHESIQDILDRVDELERQLSETKEKFENFGINVEAIIHIVKGDKQRYRAPAALRIQRCLESLCMAKGSHPRHEDVELQAAYLKERFKIDL